MITDRIERETLIEASLERVWSLVAEPGFWVLEEHSESSPRAREGESVLAKHSQYGEFTVRVEKVDRPHYIAYRWASAFPGHEPTDSNSTLVEFTLTAVEGGTMLRVVESGFSTIEASEETVATALRNNTDGWSGVMDAFKVRAEQSTV